MSLSTQLKRGFLALPLLLSFALLGLSGQSLPPVGDQPELDVTVTTLPGCALSASRNRVLVLAQAPADLGTLAFRNQPCRA